MKKIAQRLRDLRRSKNMKQKEFAKLLNISPTAYSKIETGVNEISCSHILTIKSHFNISTDWLLSGDTPIDNQDFVENLEHVRKMLADMKASKHILFSMLSHYYDKIKKQVKTGKE
jgi:transcriptional regulator with XRE-family HTH domain